MSTPTDPVALVLPVHNAAGRVAPALADWSAALKKTGREFVLLVVDDGSTDNTASVVESLFPKYPTLTLLRHDTRRGFGACLRTALPACTQPVLAYSALDYPYTPSDIEPLLVRLTETGEVYGEQKPIVAVSGARSGPPVPAAWQGLRLVYRVLARVLFGITPAKPLGWYGAWVAARAWPAWLLMGVPLQDPDSAFKAFRRDWLDRFPLQSDGDFVHAEIFAKLTFLTGLVDELPLTPKPDPLPRTRWADWWRVFRYGQFHPALPDVTAPLPPAAAQSSPLTP